MTTLTQMRILEGLVAGLRDGAIDVVDLTAPLSEDTPIIALPPERGQPWPFQREVISRYDAAGQPLAPARSRPPASPPALRPQPRPLTAARRGAPSGPPAPN